MASTDAQKTHCVRNCNTLALLTVIFRCYGLTMREFSRRAAAGGLISSLTVALVAFFVLLSTNAASAANHGQIVPEEPRRDVPVVLDGSVLAHEQVGDRIFVGGDFQQVQRPDGTVIDQPYIFAYDIDTGLLDETFRPALNNEVNALELNPAGDALYAGGRFWKWDSSFPLRIAKLSVDGTLDTSFQGSADAIVRSIAVNNNNVFMAGGFTTVGGQPRLGFAAVDASTGVVDPGFVMNVELSANSPELARGIVITSDGNTVFGMHHGLEINGNQRPALAKFDVSGPTSVLADWRVDWFGQTQFSSCLNVLRDIAISPDDSFVVIGGQGADNPVNCDSVLQYPTDGTGAIPFNWVARMYSSVFSLAVSDSAVYVGGHFCAAPLNPAPPGGSTHVRGGPDPASQGTANGCNVNDPADPANPSVKFPDYAVFRRQLAALNPANGQALPWDPGSSANLGTFDLTIIDRGLLAGMDSDRYNSILTGRSGFFDFGGAADTQAPTVAVASPTNGSIASSVTALTGTASDDFTVSSVTVRLKNVTTNEWLQADGASFAAAQADAPVTLAPTGPGAFDWNVAVGATLPPGAYEVRAFATDPVGQTAPTVISSFTVSGANSCSVALNANGEPRITWNDFVNVDDVQVRRDGSWLAGGAPFDGFHDDTTATAGSSYTYEVRWRPNGVRTDVPCSPAVFTVPAGIADTTPPVVSLTTGLTQSPGVINLAGGLTDDISGVDRLRVTVFNQQTSEYWNGTAWQGAWVWNLASLGADTWTLPNVDLTATGDYQLQFWAWDNDGNRARNSDNIKPVITVSAGGNNAPDTTPPVVSLTTALAQSPGVINLAGGVTDDISGVDRMQVTVLSLIHI